MEYMIISECIQRTKGEIKTPERVDYTCNNFSVLNKPLTEDLLEGDPVYMYMYIQVQQHMHNVYTYITYGSISLISTIRYVIFLAVLKQMSIRNVGLVTIQLRCLGVHSKEVAGDQQEHTPSDDYGVDNRGRITY